MGLKIIPLALLFSGFFLQGCDTGLTLAKKGHSDYRIVVSANSSFSTAHGTGELKKFLEEITGADIPVVSDLEPMTKHEIIVGKNSHLEQIAPDIDFEALGDEGYVIKTVGRHIIIAGGELRGNMYGVYGFLEDHLGCRWFTPEVSRIPSNPHLKLPEIDETVVPVLEYREPYIFNAKDGNWAARNRMNRNTFDGTLRERHGGQIEWVPGFFVHTFERLVPKAKYFSSHPEYFSLVNGVRMKGLSQLCCTNEDVIRIVTEGVIKVLKKILMRRFFQSTRMTALITVNARAAVTWQNVKAHRLPRYSGWSMWLLMKSGSISPIVPSLPSHINGPVMHRKL